VQPLIIEVAVNETVTKAENPHVPITVDELVQDAVECWEAGASLIHFHPRDPDCPPDRLDVGRLDDVAFYTEVMTRVKDRCDIICYPTYPYQTHDGHAGVEALFPHVQALRNDPAVALETFVFFIGASNMGWWNAGASRFETDRVNHMSHEEAARFLRWCRDSGLRPQFGVREPGHVRHALMYQDLGLVEPPLVLHLNFSDTTTFGPRPDVDGIKSFLSVVPQGYDVEWFIHDFINNFNADDLSVENHRLLNVLALGMGGHVRVGIGDLPVWGGERPKNADMVARFASLAELVGRPVATPAQTRDILGIR
jgi:3-keto-5-aminohexanoate cleavage enzyme